ncbi:MAG: glutamate-5-semialdehyde dehydrogenase [Bacteroidales bacterium]|nr:glutamate-5-semialdehyde dehydrogenase [Bacteroidales bacterium]MBN2761850.1 glutamate-5-semialdehyde dehydrogenase [Bacteroidales bacterium]
MKESIQNKGEKVKIASRVLAVTGTALKDKALGIIAEEIDKNREAIKVENSKDIDAGRAKGLSDAFIDRLTLNDKRIDGMIKILHDVINLKDPIGEIYNMNAMPNGLKVGQMRVPIGVIGIIFESRPNVCIEVASLTIKSGNGVLLKGGSDAIHSNVCLIRLIKEGLKKAGLPEGCVEIIEDTKRESVLEMVKMKSFIDIIIPRGGLQLIRFVEENSVIPVIRHDQGICHTYVDEFANIQMAVSICFNAKVQRPGVCNAMETLLVHAEIAPAFLPLMWEKYAEAGVKLRGCEKTKKILPDITDAVEEDWSAEYLDLILAVKTVESLDEAITHINQFSSHHSDSIVTDHYGNGMRFITEVDSAACFINASTRFSDGNEFGLGAEMGISNQKLHVRGPMGLKDLTAPKYIILGNGQVRL